MSNLGNILPFLVFPFRHLHFRFSLTMPLVKTKPKTKETSTMVSLQVYASLDLPVIKK